MGKKSRLEFDRFQAEEMKFQIKLKMHKDNQTNYRVYPLDILLTPLMREWSGFWIRSSDSWKCTIRSNDLVRQREDLLKHLFQKYPVPKFLERIWSDRNTVDPLGKFRAHPEANQFIPWYIALATGMSLHKDCAKNLLSRKETYIFCNAPNNFSPLQNIWWTRARAWEATLGTANNLASSRIIEKDVNDEFWLSCARFFVKHPNILLAETDDLIDWMQAKYEENPYFSMKGRTLESVRAGSFDWHRLQIRIKELDGSTWPGYPLEDWEYTVGSDEKRTLTIWRISQIRTGKELLKEGHAQHHCVASYKSSCVSGRASIWSMTYQSIYNTSPGIKRALTLELSSDGSLNQARGYANRQPTSEEKVVLDYWKRENNIYSRIRS